MKRCYMLSGNLSSTISTRKTKEKCTIQDIRFRSERNRDQVQPFRWFRPWDNRRCILAILVRRSQYCRWTRESNRYRSPSLMGIRTVRQWIEVQPTQTWSDADWVGLSMIINTLWKAGAPTQMHLGVDWVGLSMIRNTLWEAGVPTQTRLDADLVGS